ncbi:DUF1810 domain-containing protein [Ramlibacter sp. Leaf400]|uniref:DUF1810 domain-containing protein n=1 Tax=Ramlibacter sp. Leaf400 TaxID=1736365 RepID=UPI0006FC43A9|nr:DUF1810 domain-containing protein [Ramlibacter sp. Leaf400]KQT13881.1 calpastatin [Ramlibacter sp. Leaf400]
MDADPFDLERFVAAQDPVWPAVMAELQAGDKQSHWMWYVFPQLRELGRSAMARRYGLSGRGEAMAYLEHPVLGPRLRGCCETLLRLNGRTALEIFGGIDAMKLRSCLTLFASAAPGEALFGDCLRKYFEGQPDPLTVDHLRS